MYKVKYLLILIKCYFRLCKNTVAIPQLINRLNPSLSSQSVVSPGILFVNVMIIVPDGHSLFAFFPSSTIKSGEKHVEFANIIEGSFHVSFMKSPHEKEIGTGLLIPANNSEYSKNCFFILSSYFVLCSSLILYKDSRNSIPMHFLNGYIKEAAITPFPVPEPKS